MCVDTSNSFITNEWFQKTLDQHCNIFNQEICIENQFFVVIKVEVENAQESTMDSWKN